MNYYNDFDNTQVGVAELGDIGRLRQIVGGYCPDEVRKEVAPMIPAGTDELNLGDLKSEFDKLISGQDVWTDGIPRIEELDVQPLKAPSTAADDTEQHIIPDTKGFGIGIPEVDKVSMVNYEETDTIDSGKVRSDFPVLNQQVNGKPLVWFDNGATTQKPQAVIDAISGFYEHDNSNIHRGAHTLAARATDAYEGAREIVRGFIHAGSVDEIIFVRGTTEGINLVANTFGRRFVGEGDEVIVSTLDHHANIVPWQMICKEKGAKLKAIPCDSRGDLRLDVYEQMITPRTKFVSVGHVNNTFGTINDVQRIISIAHAHGIPVLVDGAQSVAHTPINVVTMAADFYVFSGHKIYGPTGIGVVYGKKKWLDQMPPWQGGGNMIKDVTIEETLFNVPPARFEAGTPNIADAVGLGAALQYVSKIGIHNISRHEHQLTEYARQQLGRIPGLTLIGDPRNRVSVVSFELDGIDTPRVGELLDKEGIAVRAGHHCAQPALRSLGYEMSVRPSFAFYNTTEEVDRLVEAVRKILSAKK